MFFLSVSLCLQACLATLNRHLHTSAPQALEWQLQVFKALMKADSCDYGDGMTLGRRKSSKAAAAAADGNEADGTGADAAAASTPALASGRLEHMQGSAGPATTAGKLPATLSTSCLCSAWLEASSLVSNAHHIPSTWIGALPVTWARPAPPRTLLPVRCGCPCLRLRKSRHSTGPLPDLWTDWSRRDSYSLAR